MQTRLPARCESKWNGDASEALILWKLVEAGILVLVPWGDNARFDLVAVISGRFLRIQCKTGRLRNGCVSFLTCGIGRDGNRYRYLPGEIDYYGVRCLETSPIYFVPYTEAGSSAEPVLRVDPPKPGSTGGRLVARVRWAGRYAGDVVIESWLRTGAILSRAGHRQILVRARLRRRCMGLHCVAEDPPRLGGAQCWRAGRILAKVRADGHDSLYRFARVHQLHRRAWGRGRLSHG